LNNNIEYDENSENDEEVYIKFKMFESAPRYGMLKNLLFDDDTQAFGDIEPGIYNLLLQRTHQNK